MDDFYLRSERLTFVPYTEEDFEFVKTLLQDSRVMRYISPGGHPYTDEEAWAWLERQLRRYETGRQTGLLKLITTEGDVIGHAGTLLQEVDRKEELEVGYWLAPRFWHLGYGREAAKRLMRYAYDAHEERIISIIHPDNVPSQRVARANGLVWCRDTVYSGIPVSIFEGDLERLFKHEVHDEGE